MMEESSDFSLQLKVRLRRKEFYVCYSTVIFSVSFSETVIDPVLKSVTRKRLIECATG
jgi:hypothetical protein